jgi:hypothetical protein
MTVIWDTALCSLVEVDRRFRDAYASIIRGMESNMSISYNKRS